MLRRFRRLPSPALVIASIALILAVGGGSFALAITDKKSDKRIAKRVSNRQITRRAPHLSVNHANSADNATQLGGLAAGALATVWGAQMTVASFGVVCALGAVAVLAAFPHIRTIR